MGSYKKSDRNVILFVLIFYGAVLRCDSISFQIIFERWLMYIISLQT